MKKLISQIAAAQQDSIMQQQYSMGMNCNPMIRVPGVPLEMVLMPAPPPPPSINPPDPTKITPVTPQEVIEKMRGRFETSSIFACQNFRICEESFAPK